MTFTHTHTFTHRRRSQPCKVTAGWADAVRGEASRSGTPRRSTLGGAGVSNSQPWLVTITRLPANPPHAAPQSSNELNLIPIYSRPRFSRFPIVSSLVSQLLHRYHYRLHSLTATTAKSFNNHLRFQCSSLMLTNCANIPLFLLFTFPLPRLSSFCYIFLPPHAHTRTHSRTHTHAHVRTRRRTCTHAHTHTHTLPSTQHYIHCII